MLSNTFSLCSSFTAIDQVSHPYRTTGKIIVIYILMFTFLGIKRKDKSVNWMVASIIRIQSDIIFLTNVILLCCCRCKFVLHPRKCL
jgi:hypothetical protein